MTDPLTIAFVGILKVYYSDKNYSKVVNLYFVNAKILDFIALSLLLTCNTHFRFY